MNGFRKLITRWFASICLAITTFTCLASCSLTNKTASFSFVESSYEKIQNIEDVEYCIYFHRDDCQYCKTFKEDLRNIALNRGLKNTVYTLETSSLNNAQKKAVQDKYSVQFVPSLVLIENGELVWTISGDTTKEELENYLTVDHE